MISCADDGSPGTLRSEIAGAPNGATIDLSALACSTITLSDAGATPYLAVLQDRLYLKGPADRHLTIDGAHQGSVLRHFGNGKLGLTDLRVSNGYSVNNTLPLAASGGCIYSSGDVEVVRSTISDCSAISVIDGVRARGGGIYVMGRLTLSASVIANNKAITTGSIGPDGGGAFVLGDLEVLYSSIAANEADTKYAGAYSIAGGVHSFGNVTISGSTISGNRADVSAGFAMQGGSALNATLSNSTISGNIAAQKFGGVWANVPLTLEDTTIAFNRALASGGTPGAGIYVAANLITQSSIVADNSSELGESDLGVKWGFSIPSGANNLIVEWPYFIPLPPDTMHDCPRLQPLRDNGGTTWTHALGRASPAIDRGNNAAGLVTDQRFVSRVIGIDADIGSYERQTSETDDRLLRAGFDAGCDW